mmetsp:Transcript_13325/g.53452  ORF Transcript_13325/g.53452 Transcript_13325/m.53452 type:complete len:321 (-) Transcript_13325:1789-2751(-)
MRSAARLRRRAPRPQPQVGRRPRRAVRRRLVRGWRPRRHRRCRPAARPRRGARRRRRPEHDSRRELLRDALRLARSARRQVVGHPVVRAARPARRRRALHADLARTGPRLRASRSRVLRDADGLEVLRQPHGAPRAVPVRRRVVRHGRRPRAREGRAVGGPRVALGPRRVQPVARRPARLGPGHRREALGDLRPQLLLPLRLRGRRQNQGDGHDGRHDRRDGREHGQDDRRLHHRHRRRLRLPRPRRRLRLQEPGPQVPHGRRLAHRLPPLGHRRLGRHRPPLPREIRRDRPRQARLGGRRPARRRRDGALQTPRDDRPH